MTAQFNETMAPLQGVMKGASLWILGAGPSLDDIDVLQLRDDYIFAMNGAYLYTTAKKHPNAWWLWYDVRAYRELWDRVKTDRLHVNVMIHKRGLEMMRSYRGSMRTIDYPQEQFKAQRTSLETAFLIADWLGFKSIFLAGVDGFSARRVDGVLQPYAERLRPWKQCNFMKDEESPRSKRTFRDHMGRVTDLISSNVYTTSPETEDLWDFMSFKDALALTGGAKEDRLARRKQGPAL